MVVMAMGAKKVDIPLNSAEWLGRIDIWQDKSNRVNFRVQMGFYRVGMTGSTLQIKARTRVAGRIMAIVQVAKANVVELATTDLK